MELGSGRVYQGQRLVGIVTDLSVGLANIERVRQALAAENATRDIVLIVDPLSAPVVRMLRSPGYFPLASEIFSCAPEVSAPFKYNREESWRRNGKRRGRR